MTHEETPVTILQKYFPGFREVRVDVGGVGIHTLVGGSGPEAVLLLHGHPESALMWRLVAPKLAEKYTVVAPDLRGYGMSDKPSGLPDHSNYSKRVMAADQIAVMDHLGIDAVHVAGHDRGARVAHRLLLDHAERVKSATLIDIVSTWDAYALTGREFATKYWHWFFYTQPYDFPEVFLGSHPEYFIHSNLAKKVGPSARANFPDDVMAEYVRYYSDPANVHAIAEDYRAAAGIDLIHDEPDRAHKFATPLLLLWGANSVVGGLYDVMDLWRRLALDVSGHAVPECGHFVPEEKPDVVIDELQRFVAAHSSPRS
ncbi:MAG: alpha/beta hydrolase [Methylobacteriaceae bacterium]|jgi:haloacetate dehalogenase|nr:alpha/beta hydrolase [Methylobacteriaceae bacterium]